MPHTARLFKIASQRQSCRLNVLNCHDCRRRDVRLGNPSRRHTHTAPITPDCLRCDGREASDRRQSGCVRRAKCRGSLNWCGRKHRKFTVNTFQTCIVYFYDRESMNTRESSKWCPPTLSLRTRHFVRDGHVMT